MTPNPLLIQIVSVGVLVYFVLLNGGYLMLNFLAMYALRRRSQEAILDDLPQVYSALEPPISMIVPAYNEAATIVTSIRSMLQLSYSEMEVVVINDGSTDQTLQVMIDEFGLVPFPEAYRIQLETKPVKAIYRSTRFPNLRVVDKVNGGKADSTNAGINAARYPLFCCVDADSILQRDSLQRLVRPFLGDPLMVATGGTVRIANGCEVRGGFLTRVGMPKNPWALFQVVEYLRAFMFGRLGWSVINGMLIISGAFGLFRKDTVVAVGGYNPKAIGEDMELVVRMHRKLRSRGIPYKIEFVPDPVCWTEAPEDYKQLRNQRIRWSRGLSESLTTNWGLMFSRHGGVAGWMAFPFFMLFEWLGPFVELFGYIFMAVSWWQGWVSWESFLIFLFLAIGLGILLSAFGLLLEEMSFHLYPRPGHLLILAAVVVLENFGYRQINSWWRLIGLYKWARREEAKWGVMTRKADWQQNMN
ncbi:Glycosyltransferase, catalytic subunit of cellulose synthase and poly-beta-1,6-N-acetylglucosamine synthase [Duganella sp. CF458]|uniref:glycosyltransferase family 2 protein n=1 Tax=Duganella sp. CF458 TaxID=1884368 RepID=UPI0008EC34D2|nr:glycosyltransferase [Duganella sp. CF458]SFG46752.1 Glycosyltransferase, catalytic subunit of cellulose synthase and poly-beta-1,6-N-acetylglucosamine synthase [Duganella sp. CF458]